MGRNTWGILLFAWAVVVLVGLVIREIGQLRLIIFVVMVWEVLCLRS
jgi:hypothetical protein